MLLGSGTAVSRIESQSGISLIQGKLKAGSSIDDHKTYLRLRTLKLISLQAFSWCLNSFRFSCVISFPSAAGPFGSLQMLCAFASHGQSERLRLGG